MESPNYEFYINPKDPWADDIFRRKNFAEKITPFLSETSRSQSIVIDGEWGSGKTIFLNRFAAQLKKENFPVIHIDAFKHDYADDPFLVIASAIYQFDSQRNDDLRVNIFPALLPVAQSIVKIGTAITPGAPSLGALGKSAIEVGSELLSAKIKGGYEEEQSREKLKEKLTELSKKAGDHNKPLIIIIDELDRCRPSFAIKLLENIKHIFTANNVHFVFGAYIHQLETSVKSVYGNETDAYLYLMKFFDWNFQLPASSEATAKTTQEAYAYKLIYKFKYDYKIDHFDSEFSEFFIDLCVVKKLSLRKIEKVFSQLLITFFNNRTGSLPKRKLLLFLCAAKALYPEIYQKIISENVELQDIQTVFGQKFENDFDPHRNDRFAYSNNESIAQCIALLDDRHEYIPKDSFTNRKSPSNLRANLREIAENLL